MSLREYRKYGRAAEQLEAAVKAGNVSHAYIFEGDANLDKLGFARAFAQAVLCSESPGEGCGSCLTCRKIMNDNYEDLYHVQPTLSRSKNLSIRKEDMELLQARLKLVPSAGDRNLAIIEGGDLMTARVQNQLLKTLEEPGPGTVIMILSENTENLLPTINSRCTTYRLTDLDGQDEEGMNAFAAQVLDMVWDKALFFQVRALLDGQIKEKQDARAFLDALEKAMSGELRSGNKDVSRSRLIYGIRCVESARRDIERNVPFRYAIRESILKVQSYKW